MRSPGERLRSPATRAGFTLIEMMIVVGIIAILATIAVPSLQGKIVREQIIEAMKISDVAKGPVAAGWALAMSLPADNADAGLPAADKIVGNYVSRVAVEAGAIHVTFGNSVNGAIKGKTLSLRPAVVEGEKLVPVAWVCSGGPVPAKMTLHGTDRTDLPKQYLPGNCR